ncbi:MAG: hypothetical protein K2K41_07355 [Ruminiclostridium sp.]|nr:hypothetical protein [Ruminiclostridium sp.]
MKGIIRGFEPADYISKKTGKPVKGATIYFDCKSKSVFGYRGKDVYIPADTPIYKRTIEPLLEKFYEEDSDVYGGTIIVDIDVTQRGAVTFTDVIDLTIIPRSDETAEPQKSPPRKQVKPCH